MANSAAVDAARKGTIALQRWENEYRPRQLDLSGADLQGADLRWMNFAGANLAGANFSSAVLTGAYFGPASFDPKPPFVPARNVPALLSDASFEEAILLAATFNYTVLRGADFTRAYMGLANFRYIDFEGVSFRESELLDTSFCGCNLGHARHLDLVRNLGPSHIDFETLVRSPRLSKTFLTGLGVPDAIVDYALELPAAISPINFYSCFISHSYADKPFCDRLHGRLRAEGLRAWYAPEDMRAGSKIQQQVTSAIHLHDKLLIVLSQHSIQSDWVNSELRTAKRREKEAGRRILFPISIVPVTELQDWRCLDDDGNDLATELRSYFIPDFSNWQDQTSFEDRFQRLLRDLRASDTAAAQIEKHTSSAVAPQLPLFQRSEGHLPQQVLRRILTAATELGLHEARSALLVSIDPLLVASLALSTEPIAQLLIDLQALNRIEVRSVTSPLILWLETACTLRPGFAECDTFREAITMIMERQQSSA